MPFSLAWVLENVISSFSNWRVNGVLCVDTVEERLLFTAGTVIKLAPIGEVRVKLA